MADLAEIKEVVKRTLAPEFGNVRILDVRVRRDVDADGDDVLLIDMILDGSPLDIDVHKRLGAVGLIRPKLGEIGETTFPVLSLIALSDIGKTTFEPA